MGSLLSAAPGALAWHLQAPITGFSGIPEKWVGLGLAAGAWAHGLSRRRVPGHFSHRKGTRRRVKVAVNV